MAIKTFQAPRGTTDILPEEQGYWRLFEEKAAAVAEMFGYERIDTPIIEDAELFVRVVGESTDIVDKETYTFEDRGGDLITLRPEGTAPVCRAYLQNGMQNLPQPVRLYYFCPVFRYDRPQAGRFREHHQFGVEILGDSNPVVDAEVIELAWKLLGDVGLDEFIPLVNSVGDEHCRPAYVEALKSYFNSNVVQTCPNCPRRLEENPLRLLDCKEESCQKAIAGAPSSVEYLCSECAEHWEALTGHLENLSIPYTVDKRLVRGLDYYTRTVFEIVPQDVGSQSTIAGGGRYDGLVEELGGRPTPGMGFGMGIERVLMELKRKSPKIDSSKRTKVFVAYLDGFSKTAGLALCSTLREGGTTSILAPSGRSLKSQLRYASAIRATHAVIIGERELANRTVTVRDLNKGEQTEILYNELQGYLVGR